MLTIHQQQLLRAAVDRVIPPDEWPGGWEAGVGDYLYGQFERDLNDLVGLYRAGLDALDAEARATMGAGFAELDPAARDALLARVEAGEVTTGWPTDPARFFHLLVEHAMEGYYSDPGNGGNRGRVSWEMIGFEVRG